MEDSQQEPQDIAQETPVADVFIPPSIHREQVLLGDSYTHHSAIPATIKNDMTTECVLGVDEAGRGPVLGMRTSNEDMKAAHHYQGLWCTGFTICHFQCIDHC